MPRTSDLRAHRTQKILGRELHRSPDHTLVASVISLQQLYRYGRSPSRVEIRSAGGRLLASRDHSARPNEGFTVEKAAWTADSRFFVYQVSESGGHSPWHHPIFLYSRTRHRFYCLDLALEALGNGDGSSTDGMRLRSPCTVLAQARYHGKSLKGLRVMPPAGDEEWAQVAINLKWLEPRLNRSVEDYHYEAE